MRREVRATLNDIEERIKVPIARFNHFLGRGPYIELVIKFVVIDKRAAVNGYERSIHGAFYGESVKHAAVTGCVTFCLDTPFFLVCGVKALQFFHIAKDTRFVILAKIAECRGTKIGFNVAACEHRGKRLRIGAGEARTDYLAVICLFDIKALIVKNLVLAAFHIRKRTGVYIRVVVGRVCGYYRAAIIKFSAAEISFAGRRSRLGLLFIAVAGGKERKNGEKAYSQKDYLFLHFNLPFIIRL